MVTYLKNASSTLILLSALCGIALALSSTFFLDQSLRLDESQSLWQASHGVEGILYIVAQDVHLPFYHLLLHFWQQLFGNSVETARLLSLAFFVFSIPALYLLGRHHFDESTALFAVLLFAISPFMNWYGNEIRMYSLLVFLTILNQYFFLKFSRGESRNLYWLGYAVSALFGIYTHYFFFLVLAAQATFFFVFRSRFPPKAWRRFALVAAVLLLAILPWLIYVNQLGLANNYRPIIPSPTIISIFNAFSQFAAGFHDDHTNSLILSTWPLLVLLGFLALQRNKQFDPEAAYLLYATILPVAIAFAISSAIRPVFLARYLIIILPSLYLLVAWLVSRYSPRISLVFKGVLAGAMVIMLLIQNASATTPVKEDYRAASLYLDEHATAQDIIVVSAPFTIYPLDYYYRGSATIGTLPIWNRFETGPIPAFSDTELAEDVRALSSSHQKLWLLLSYDQGYEENVRLYLDGNFQKLESHEFSPGLTLSAYQLRYDQESFAEALARVVRESPALAEAASSSPRLVSNSR